MELHTVADRLQDAPREVIAPPEAPDNLPIGWLAGFPGKHAPRCRPTSPQTPGAVREKFPQPYASAHFMAPDRAYGPAPSYDPRLSDSGRSIARHVNRAAAPEDH